MNCFNKNILIGISIWTMKYPIVYIVFSLLQIFCFQGINSQTGVSIYYKDFSDGIMPAGWETTTNGYTAAIVDQAFELSISKVTSGDSYILENISLNNFDFRSYFTISYRTEDTLQVAVRILSQSGSISPQEIFTLPASLEYISYTFNLSALASESWGYHLKNIQMVFQPISSEYKGVISINEVIVGDSVDDKNFKISHDQRPQFSVDLGNDTVITGSSVLNLDAGNPGKFYIWNSGETTQTITVDTSGIYYVSVIGEHNCVITDTIQVTFEVHNGIPAQNNGSELIIYPNPAQTIVNIEVSDELIGSELQIIDITGRVMEKTYFTSGLYILNISDYLPGLYYVGIPVNSIYLKLIKN